MKIQKLFEAKGRQHKKNLQKEIARLKSEVPKAKQDEMQNAVLKYQYDLIQKEKADQAKAEQDKAEQEKKAEQDRLEQEQKDKEEAERAQTYQSAMDPIEQKIRARASNEDILPDVINLLKTYEGGQ